MRKAAEAVDDVEMLLRIILEHRIVEAREEVDEVFQLAFLKLHQARTRYDSKYSFLQWLFVIARSVFLDFQRAKGRRVSIDFEADVEKIEAIESPVEAERSAGVRVAHHRRGGVARPAEQLGERGQGDGADLGFVDASGQTVSRTIVREAERGQPVKLGHLPTLFARLDSRRVERDQKAFGVIAFNVWMTPISRQFDEAVDADGTDDARVAAGAGEVAAAALGAAGTLVYIGWRERGRHPM